MAKQPAYDDTGLFRVLSPEGKQVKRRKLDLSDKLLRRLYLAMLRNRELDTRMLRLQRQGRIAFYGAATGQEASIVGCAAAFEPHDWIFPALREGGVALYRGFPLEQYVAQNVGCALDATSGRQMPSHYCSREVLYVSLSSPIGTQIPQAVGCGYGIKRRGTKQVVAAFMGDGATSEPDFHAALTFAGVWKVPVVFICVNNQWAISVPNERQTASETFAIKARAYGFPGFRVDGNDVLAVREVVSHAASHARAGKGPVLVEAVTYRRGGHSSADDPSKYRDESKVPAWQKIDPIERYRLFLKRKKLWTQTWQDAWLKDFETRFKAAVAAAEESGTPSVQSMFEGVTDEPFPAVARQAANTSDGPVSELDGKFPI